MKKAILIILSLTIILTAGWWRTYGEEGKDRGYCVQQTTDGGYIVSGMFTIQEGSTIYDQDVWLIKTDDKGNIEWNRQYDRIHHDVGWCVQQTSDGGYIVACTSGWQEVWLLKVNPSGDSMWSKYYGIGEFRCVRQTNDDGYIILGTKGSDSDGCRIWLIKTDSLGGTIWTREYGQVSYGDFIDETVDGGFIIAGYTLDLHDDPVGDAWLLKTDSLGDTLWTKYFYWHGFSCVQETTDTNYVVCGFTGEMRYPPYWDWTTLEIRKLDREGNDLWGHTYGKDITCGGSCVKQSSDGGYIVTGRVINGLWLVKTDDQGDTLWTRTYGEEYNGAGGNYVDLTYDGGYIVTGWAEWPIGNPQLYLIKTDSLGLLAVEEPAIQAETQPTFEVVTNLGSQVQLVSYAQENQILNIFDASGRIVDEVLLDGPGT
ncbi:hypothetical protein GF338_10475, partial [candidate division WOR-3 bacterium]|nr:hypothetical protein [candidate division WOR-3 bacterium]